MSKEAVAEKVVETVVENAEPVVETTTSVASNFGQMVKGGNPKVVVGTVIVAGGLLTAGYFIKKKIEAKKCKDEVVETSEIPEEEE